MRRALPITTLALFAALPIAANGCVQQDRYEQLLLAKRSLDDQLVHAQDERDTARANLATAQAELTQTRSELGTVDAKFEQLVGDFDQAAETNDEFLRRITQLELGPLPPDVASALAAMAMSHSDLVSFDAHRGMVRFASDFTFDLGMDALKVDADTTVMRLAEILNTETAGVLEVRIVGHTDNVPIERPETRRRHPSNLHLSVHRAIAVRDALVDAGLEASRIEVAGNGEFRPIVPNGPKGAAENRRVEIFVGPMPGFAARAPADRIRTIDPPMK